jgi:hypothetical protein
LSCQRAGMCVSGAGGNIFKLAPTTNAGLSERVINWFNDIVLPTWRSNCTAGTPVYGERVPVPPRVPGNDVIVWVEHVTAAGDETQLAYKRDPSSCEWRRIDPDATQNMAIPPDPIRVNHDAFFKEIFDTVGIPARARKEVPNRYYKDTSNKEPWYAIKLGEVQFTVGPRKRVINIELIRPDGKDFGDSTTSPFDYDVLSDLAKKDQVTYSSTERSILIHAWGKDKAIEYLGILVGAAVPVLDRMAEI